MLCLVRSVEEVDDFDFIDCTIIGLGLNVTQPDLMAQLMGNAREISAADFKPQDVCVHELDSITDLQRGQRELTISSRLCRMNNVGFKICSTV